MDEIARDEVVEFPNGLNRKNEFSLKPGSSDIMQSDEMVAYGVNDCHGNLNDPYSNVLNGKDLDRIGSSGHASASPRCMDDTGVMVEELTLKNYDVEKLTVIGASDNKEKLNTRRSQWQHLYQIAGGLERGKLPGQIGNIGKDQATSNAREDGGNNIFSGLLNQNQPLPTYSHDVETLSNNDRGTSGDMLYSSGAIRTKMLSKSGFHEYFIKSTLRGKGVIHKSPAYRESGAAAGDLDQHKSGVASLTKSDTPLDFAARNVPLPQGVSASWTSCDFNNNGDGISLRDWMKAGRNKANKVNSLCIFRQVLDLVDISHSRGVSLTDLRPSCFKLSGSLQVTYVGSSIHATATENFNDKDTCQSSHNQNEKRPIHQSMASLDNQSMKKQNLGENMNSRRWPQFPSRSSIRLASKSLAHADVSDPHHPGIDVVEEHNQGKSIGLNKPNSLQPLQASIDYLLEEKWYASPELFNEKSCTFASNVYALGVLLFELLGSFDSGRSHAAAMHDLRHRILPPRFLSENPKEAGFCLWLIHPEPSSRPTIREILQSEFISGIEEISGSDLFSSIDEEDEESELLLYFLSALNEQKQKDASTLLEQIQRIEVDIQEVEKRRPKKVEVPMSLLQESSTIHGKNNSDGGTPDLDMKLKISPASSKETMLMSNIRHLESAYFSMIPHVQMSESDAATHGDKELLKGRETWSSKGKGKNNSSTTDHLGDFYDGLCKYARYSKFEVRGTLRNGEFNNSANVICSLSFDRDENFLAAGGVSKKIKVYEFESLFNDSVDVHYPVLEMANRSKLSCICWNSYIRNYLASTDYDGMVKLWDASTGQGFSNFTEHSERAWSVDFSHVDPRKLASGGDDRLVKLWSINDKNSSCTIRNNANVCCVQFSAESSHLLAFSSADYKIYCYDLRNVSTPWCILAGHQKAVSYAKFLDAGTLVSASTDNTLKIWDLSKTSSNCLSRNACVSTLRGHTNEKNFVGLSATNGYITCGSETNEVFAYYKSQPMPITAHRFGSIDPITGKETEDGNGQFVSSVCWRRKSNMVVAANSSGCIKLLQMV